MEVAGVRLPVRALSLPNEGRVPHISLVFREM